MLSSPTPRKPLQRKPPKCRHCKKRFSPRTPLQTVCFEEVCREKEANQAAAKAARREINGKREERRQDREKRESFKTKGQLTQEAQKAFNEFIRLRDMLAGHPCISSGKPLNWTGNDVDAGHYRSVGSAPHLRFNEDNCHAQSKKENRYRAGNAVDYRINLIVRIGLERILALEADNTPRHYTREELIELRRHYKAKTKALKEVIG